MDDKGILQTVDDNSLDTSASFVLRTEDNIDPDIFTSRLGIQPTRMTRKGEKISERSKHIAKCTIWMINSNETVKDNVDPNWHLEYILGRIEPVKQALLAVVDEYDLEMYIDLIWYSHTRERAFCIPSTILWRMADIKVILEMNFNY